MRQSSCLAAVLFLFCAAPGAAATPRLVRDINEIPQNAGSHPEGFAALGDVSLFLADDGDSGREIWRSDGTAAGTFQVAEVCDETCLNSALIDVCFDGVCFFTVVKRDGSSLSWEYWATAGRPGDARLLLDRPVYNRVWIPGQRRLYLMVEDQDKSIDLWVTNGTRRGTRRVFDFPVAADVGRFPEITSLAGKPFFRADDGSGPALWTSDGTTPGTRPVKRFGPPPGDTGPEILTVAGRYLYFYRSFVDDRTPITRQLWRSDGTPAGTIAVPGFAGSATAQFGYPTAAGGRLYFAADFDDGRGQELWISDGSRRGTRRLTDFRRADAFVELHVSGSDLNGRLLFRADDGLHGYELWTSDGTTGGTRLTRDICPGSCSSGVLPVLSSGFARIYRGSLYFGATSPRGRELWRSDGTAAGTALVRDICRGACSAEPDLRGVVNDRLIFNARNAGGGGLWRTDGTAGGTVRFSDVEMGGGSPIPGALLFQGNDGTHGEELWRTDGTREGTSLVADISTTAVGGSFPGDLRAVGDRVFFFADDGLRGSELWVSDGTAGGTSLADELVPGPEGFRPQLTSSAALAGKLLFCRSGSEGAAPRLWASDGTSPGTVQLTPEDTICGDQTLVLGARLFFTASEDDSGRELWVSDGTPAGTRQVADVRPGSFSSNPRDFTVYRGRLFFTAESEDGRELWASDGTVAGTGRVADLHAGSRRAHVEGGLEVFRDRLYFTVRFGTLESELWSTDGTAQGTSLVRPFEGSLLLPTEHAGWLYFLVHRSEQDIELWRTDGTPAGTASVAQVGLPATPPDFSRFFALIPAGPRLYLVRENVIWVSDGTAAGTQPVTGPDFHVFSGADLLVFEGALYLLGDNGFPFSKVDGTEAVPVLDRNGEEIHPEWMAVLNDRLYLAEITRLWQSDGTQHGTEPVATPAGFSVEGPPVRAGSRLFFPAFDRATGSELWAIDGD
jgi:ELWxxDGT repeat protein